MVKVSTHFALATENYEVWVEYGEGVQVHNVTIKHISSMNMPLKYHTVPFAKEKERIEAPKGRKMVVSIRGTGKLGELIYYFTTRMF